MSKQVRQGDVLLEPCSKPVGAKILKSRGRRLVLAHGDSTGHDHYFLTKDCTLYDRGTEPLPRHVVNHVYVRRQTRLSHPEHVPPIAVARGWYQVRRAFEFDPIEDAMIRD